MPQHRVGAAPDNITAFSFFIRDICLRTTPRDTSRAKMLAFRRNTISEAKISVPPRRSGPISYCNLGFQVNFTCGSKYHLTHIFFT